MGRRGRGGIEGRQWDAGGTHFRSNLLQESKPASLVSGDLGFGVCLSRHMGFDSLVSRRLELSPVCAGGKCRLKLEFKTGMELWRGQKPQSSAFKSMGPNGGLAKAESNSPESPFPIPAWIWKMGSSKT